jgi:leucyl/phenylalanyl-tRNA--protein transferase
VRTELPRKRFRPWLLPPGCPAIWPDPDEAQPDEGLVAVGGDLSAERLVSAYAHGIFPWYNERSAILWWSPDPRAILRLSELHVSRSMQRRMRKGGYVVTTDMSFASVVDGCAERDEGTWITADMRSAYICLHQIGHAHSFEVWDDQQLTGGLYGVQVGGLFAAESMFHRTRDASKIALLGAVQAVFAAGLELFDVQFMTPHLASLGTAVISRSEYLALVARATNREIAWERVRAAIGKPAP